MGQTTEQIEFTVDQVMEYPPAWFVREVSLTSLFPGVKPENVPLVTLKVVRWWRGRVSCFKKWRLIKRLEGDKSWTNLMAMLNCSPAFAICSPQTWGCQERFCPFCHARAMLVIWKRIDGQLFGTTGSPKTVISIESAAPSGKVKSRALSLVEDMPAYQQQQTPPVLAGTTMITRSITCMLPFDAAPKLLTFLAYRTARVARFPGKKRRPRTGIKCRRTELKALGVAGVTGGVDVTYVGFVYMQDGKIVDGQTARRKNIPPTHWEVVVEQVMFAPTAKIAKVVGNLPATPQTRVSHTEYLITRKDTPTRFDVLHAMAHAMRYSRVPMDGSKEHLENLPRGQREFQDSIGVRVTPQHRLDQKEVTMASSSERHQVVEALADAYVNVCDGLPPEAKAESKYRYQIAAFSVAIDLVRRVHRDVTGDESVPQRVRHQERRDDEEHER